MDATITLIVNGQERTVVTDPQRSLLEVLREDLKLTGTNFSCQEGQCGACAVLMSIPVKVVVNAEGKPEEAARDILTALGVK